MFKNWWLKFQPYYDVPTVSAPGGGGGSRSPSEVNEDDTLNRDLAELNSDEEVKEGDEEEVEEEKEEGSSEKDDESEVEEDKDNEEEEVEEEKEEKEENVDPVREATYKSIKKEYPEFFKKFPAIKDALFRADAYTRIFPSTEDAKAASETVESFNALKDIVVSGKADEFLTQVKDLGGDSLRDFAGNFLPALVATDEKLYYKIVTPVVRSALKTLVNYGKQKGGKVGGKESNEGQNLINAAVVAHLELFGNGDVEKDDVPVSSSRGKEEDPERKKFNSEREEYYKGRYQDLMSSANSEIQTTLFKEIENGLDPEKKLSSYARKHLVQDIFVEIDKTLSKDDSHLKFVNALWKQEQSVGFSGKNKERIIKAVLSRARPLIAPTRQRLRASALDEIKGKKEEVVSKKKNDVRPHRIENKGKNPKSTNEMSDLDIINS
jgi:hypothetical protein